MIFFFSSFSSFTYLGEFYLTSAISIGFVGLAMSVSCFAGYEMVE